jgi:hypothetical protein
MRSTATEPQTHFYEPAAGGLEIRIGEKLAELRAANAEARGEG